MPEVFTASYNPVTGERREFRQEVAPPPPPDYGMSSINPAAVEALYRTQKIEDANKAVSAAIQFQGLRGYQQALEKGEPAEKALARYGPMMFYSKPQAFGPSVKALTPPKPPQPRIMPIPGGGIVSVDPTTQKVNELRAPTAKPPTPIIRSSNGGLFLIDPKTQTAKPLTPPKPPTDYAAVEERKMAAAAYKAAVEELERYLRDNPRKEPWVVKENVPLIGGKTFGGNLDEIAELEKKRDEARAKLQGGSTLSERAAATSTGPETIRLTKDGRKAIFDSQTRKFLRYAD